MAFENAKWLRMSFNLKQRQIAPDDNNWTLFYSLNREKRSMWTSLDTVWEFRVQTSDVKSRLPVMNVWFLIAVGKLFNFWAISISYRQNCKIICYIQGLITSCESSTKYLNRSKKYLDQKKMLMDIFGWNYGNQNGRFLQFHCVSYCKQLWKRKQGLLLQKFMLRLDLFCC